MLSMIKNIGPFFNNIANRANITSMQKFSVLNVYWELLLKIKLLLKLIKTAAKRAHPAGFKEYITVLK